MFSTNAWSFCFSPLSFSLLDSILSFYFSPLSFSFLDSICSHKMTQISIWRPWWYLFSSRSYRIPPWHLSPHLILDLCFLCLSLTFSDIVLKPSIVSLSHEACGHWFPFHSQSGLKWCSMCCLCVFDKCSDKTTIS